MKKILLLAAFCVSFLFGAQTIEMEAAWEIGKPYHYELTETRQNDEVKGRPAGEKRKFTLTKTADDPQHEYFTFVNTETVMRDRSGKQIVDDPHYFIFYLIENLEVKFRIDKMKGDVEFTNPDQVTAAVKEKTTPEMLKKHFPKSSRKFVDIDALSPLRFIGNTVQQLFFYYQISFPIEEKDVSGRRYSQFTDHLFPYHIKSIYSEENGRFVFSRTNVFDREAAVDKDYVEFSASANADLQFLKDNAEMRFMEKYAFDKPTEIVDIIQLVEEKKVYLNKKWSWTTTEITFNRIP